MNNPNSGGYIKHKNSPEHTRNCRQLFGVNRRLTRNPISVEIVEGKKVQTWHDFGFGIGPLRQVRTPEIYRKRKQHISKIIDIITWFCARGVPFYGDSQSSPCTVA